MGSCTKQCADDIATYFAFHTFPLSFALASGLVPLALRLPGASGWQTAMSDSTVLPGIDHVPRLSSPQAIPALHIKCNLPRYKPCRSHVTVLTTTLPPLHHCTAITTALHCTPPLYP